MYPGALKWNNRTHKQNATGALLARVKVPGKLACLGVSGGKCIYAHAQRINQIPKGAGEHPQG